MNDIAARRSMTDATGSRLTKKRAAFRAIGASNMFVRPSRASAR